MSSSQIQVFSASTMADNYQTKALVIQQNMTWPVDLGSEKPQNPTSSPAPKNQKNTSK